MECGPNFAKHVLGCFITEAHLACDAALNKADTPSTQEEREHTRDVRNIYHNYLTALQRLPQFSPTHSDTAQEEVQSHLKGTKSENGVAPQYETPENAKRKLLAIEEGDEVTGVDEGNEENKREPKRQRAASKPRSRRTT